MNIGMRSSVGQIAHVTTQEKSHATLCLGKVLPCRSAAIQKRTGR